MSAYAVTLTINTEADSAEEAAGAFGEYVSVTKHYSVTVDNMDTNETEEVEL